jgi:RND family efflux transporter MFP subunit
MVLLLVLAIGIVLASGEAEQPPPPPTIRAVEGMVLHPRARVVDSFETTGTARNNRVSRMSAEITGRVERYAGRDDRFENGELIEVDSPPLDEGDPVVAGQPIVLLNRELLKAARDAAKAELEYTAADVKRIQDSYEKGVATRMELDRVMMQWKMAKASLDIAEANLDRTCVRAEIDGVLNSLPVEYGELVQPGTVVAQIVDADPMKIEINLPEKDVSFFRVGESQHVLLDDRDEPLEGRVTYISEVADPQTHTTRMEVTVPNIEIDGHRALRDGQIVRLDLVRRILHDQMMIPVRAVTPLERGYAAYVAVDGQAERRWINLDERMLKDQEVRLLPPTDRQRELADQAGDKAGLAPGDVLILQPAIVGPGQRVTVVDLQGRPGPFDPKATAAPAPAPDDGPGGDQPAVESQPAGAADATESTP